ncbi:inactive serine/threonine-protein kinase TEX14-like isoform X4 [Equus asinus]|uniref:inactive serine/threonine-protein kinase TEX14-like isoform X4 n=1 Tax=Equus asinus TaxID=9793 RepID=UPI0038F6BA69
MPLLRSRFPVKLGSVRDPEGQVGRLHRLAVAGGPGWGLSRLLRRVVQVDGENSAGQTGLFLSALLGHSSAVQLLLAFGANPNHRCLDGSTPVHAGAFSGHSLVVLQLLRAGGDLRLHDQQGRTPRDWAEQGGAEQSQEVLELLQLCCANISALVHGADLAPTASLGQLQASSGRSLCCSLSRLWLVQADRAPRPEQIRGPRQIPGLGFGQLSSLWPVGLVTGIPLADPKELLPAQGEPERTYKSSSHTLMINLLWRGHPVTVRQLTAPGSQPDVLLADLQHCSTLHHPNLLLLMALSPSADLLGLRLLFEPVWLGSLYVVLHPQEPSEGGPHPAPGLLPGHLLLQVLEALLFLQARWRAHGGLSSHAVQLVRPGLAKVGSLEHGRPLHQRWLQPRPQQGCLWGGPGPGLPPPPELYPWLPLELICGDTPAATSDLYSFCILAQEVFTETLYYEVASRAKTTPRPVPPVMSLGPSPSQALETPEVTGHSRVQRGPAWDSGSSLTLGSSPSPSHGLCPGHSPTARVSLRHGLEPSSTGPALHSSLQDPPSLLGTRALWNSFRVVLSRSEPCRGCGGTHTGLPRRTPSSAPSPGLIREGLFSSLQKMDLLEEIIAELDSGGQLGGRPSRDPPPGTHS